MACCAAFDDSPNLLSFSSVIGIPCFSSLKTRRRNELNLTVIETNITKCAEASLFGFLLTAQAGAFIFKEDTNSKIRAPLNLFAVMMTVL